jgi:pyrroline-5-carboxylate reductase
MEKKIGIIGYGSMGKMLLNGFVNSKITDRLFVSNRDKGKLLTLKTETVHICNSNSELADICDTIFICVKPLEVKGILYEIRNNLNNDKHIITIAGSLKIMNLEKIYAGKITRIMPTIISEINEGITLVYHNSKVLENDKRRIEKLLEPFTELKNIPEEEFNIIAELTSCAPGIIAGVFREYVKTALKYSDIDTNEINKIVSKTLYGTSKLFYEKEYGFDETIERVATKGGTTEKGVKVLEAKLPEVFEEMFCKMLESQKVREEKIDEQYKIY